MRSFVVLFSLLISSSAFASVDAKCEGLVKPADYNEQAQQDFLSNYVALATTFSALHGPIPDEPGHGSLGLELSIIPPLGCERRMVLNYSKTEEESNIFWRILNSESKKNRKSTKNCVSTRRNCGMN